ncbi:MAG: DEAD/DEAH box helicase, partial [Candidatus Limnocylindrales bacterium]
MTFDTLGLRPESLRAIADQGYTHPTPVQEQAIPAILTGRDLLAGAQTGTGKTAAFVLPMLQTLHATRAQGPRRVRGLVVVPTRELALQVEASIRTYGAHRPVRSAAVFGGMSMDRQVRALRSGVEVVVATPGRLLDHVRQRTIDLRQVEILVLDEADRMLDMGFIHDIRKILHELPSERQSLLFSATFEPRIRRLAEDLLREPLSIDVAPRNATATPIRQVVHPVDKGQKRHLLAHMLRTRSSEQALVFTRTKRGANRLAEQLGKDGINAAAIHGNKSQSQRMRALTAFKQGRSQVLVATDIAARGLDIEALPHVVNYELPNVPEDYVHRIGRTGRAGMAGTATSLVGVEEQELMAAIEKLL